MVCAADEAFANPLPLLSEHYIDGDPCYTFAYRADTIPDRLYIRRPDLYLLSVGISPAAVPCRAGETAYYQDREWFTIDSVSVSSTSAGVFDIAVSVRAHQSVVPETARLRIGGSTLTEFRNAPDSDIRFDENQEYLSETFCFRYNTGARSDISGLLDDAVLTIDTVSPRIRSVDIHVTCDAPAVELIVE